MARKAMVELLGDASSFSRSLKQSAEQADQFRHKISQLAVDTKSSANAQIQATLRRDERLRGSILAYKALASEAAKGSREQIVANRLASESVQKLTRSLGLSDAEARRVHGSFGIVGRDIERAGRGAIFGSGAFREMGRSALYAGSSLLVGAGVVEGLKSTIKAATDARATMGQLSTAVRDAGISYSLWRGTIDDTLKSSEKLGFTQQQSAAGFSNLVRATKDVSKASKDMALAQDISRARGLPLVNVTLAIAKAETGHAAALQRLGVAMAKGVTTQEGLRLATIAYGGAAVKWSQSAAGAQARLSVAIEETKVKIGTALLPTITKLSASLADWLDKDNNQIRIQRDVKEAIHAVSVAVGLLKSAFDTARPIVQGVSDELGGLKQTLKILAVTVAAFKLSHLLDGIGGIGMKSKVASGEVSVLRSKLLALRSIGLVGVTVAIAFEVAKEGNQFDKWLGGTGFGQAIGAGTHQANAAAVKNMLAQGKSFADIEKIGIFLDASGKAALAAAEARAAKQPGWSGVLSGLSSLGASSKTRGQQLPSAISGGGRSGRAALTPMQRAQLALSAAGATASTADDLAALTSQRALLAREIATERARLNSAPTAKEASKFADNLKSLQDQDAAAYSQITSIEQSAATKAKAEMSKATKAMLDGLRAKLTLLKTAVKTSHDGQKAENDLKAFLLKESTNTGLSAVARAGFAGQLATEKAREGAVEKRRRAAVAKAVQAGQFAALGLGATGQGQSPLRESLKTELAKVSGALKGTLLDTDKNTHLLGQVGKVLDGQFGALTDKTRAAIRRMLDTLKKELGKSSDLAHDFHATAVSSKKLTGELIAGLHMHLTPAQRAMLESRVRTAQAFGGHIPASKGVLGQSVKIDHLHLHGIQDTHQLADALTKLGKSKPTQTVGPNAGRSRALP